MGHLTLRVLDAFSCLAISSYFTINSSLFRTTFHRIYHICVFAKVGITTLASGFTGVISIGLFLLGITVAIGVAKGELDPNNEKVDDTPIPL